MEMVAPTLSAYRFEKLIGEYTARKITYEHDTLNACLGVLNYMGFKHLWGIVIRKQPFSLELCWVLRCNGASEKEAFPSWSWTRWKATVDLHPQKYPSSIASIKAYLPSGEEFDIVRDTRYDGNLGAICPGKMLRITGTFLTSRFLVVEEAYGVACYSILSCACGADIKMRTSLDMGTGSGTGSVASTTAYLDDTEILEITPLYKDAKGHFSGQFLLVKRHMDAYRRIGVGCCDKHYWIKHVCGKLECSEGGIIPMKGSYTKTIDLV
jgi:hypothetical protein